MFTSEDLQQMKDMARTMYINHELSPDAYASVLEDLKLAERRVRA
jgi:hypothetical protein